MCTGMNRQYDVFEITIIDIASVTKIGFSKHDKPYENVRLRRFFHDFLTM